MFLRKLKSELLYNPAVSLIISPREMKFPLSKKHLHPYMLAAVLRITQKWKQSVFIHQSMDNVVHVRNGVSLRYKKGETVSLATTCMEVETIIK